ncbi:MAG TPA: cation transporter [Ktedonobacteraceae bacterium]|nr:cation transporter [Ktedonobacteraceae bacterium]
MATDTHNQELSTPIGAETTPSQIAFAVEGMTCASCAMRIEKGLKKLPGIMDASVNLATEQASVSYDPGQASIEQMEQKVDALGYKATPLTAPIIVDVEEEEEDEGHEEELTPEDVRNLRRQAEITRKRNLLSLGIVLSLPVLVLSMFFMNRFPGENYLLLLLTAPIWAIVGWDFHRHALKTLRHGSATMDTLVSLGSTAAFLLSVVATFFPAVFGSMTFYDSAALIVTLIFLG